MVTKVLFRQQKKFANGKISWKREALRCANPSKSETACGVGRSERPSVGKAPRQATFLITEMTMTASYEPSVMENSNPDLSKIMHGLTKKNIFKNFRNFKPLLPVRTAIKM